MLGNGMVELDLHLNDSVVTFWVPEIDALVISLFDNTSTISFQSIVKMLAPETPNPPKLSRQNNVSHTATLARILNALNEWITRKVLILSKPGVYSVNEAPTETDLHLAENAQHYTSSSNAEALLYPYDRLHDIQAQSEGGVQDEDMLMDEDATQEEGTLKSVIVGMLTNQGPSTIEQIHSRMAMFLKYSKPISSLRSVLNTLHLKGVISRNINEAYYI